MAVNTYGTYNPRALEPYPIEGELAKIGYGGSPASAQTLLDQYWLERQANEYQYGKELSAQHDQARQQLAAQIYDSNVKAFSDVSKNPGALQLAASSPYYQGILGGASPDVVQDVINQQGRTQQATNLEHAGSGALSMSSAGTPVDPQSLTNLIGAPVTPGQRPDITIQGMKDASKLAAARISAAGANKGPSFTGQLPPQPQFGNMPFSMSVPKGMRVDDAMKIAQAQGLTIHTPTPLPPSLDTQTPAGGGATLPPAKTDTPANAPPKAAPSLARASTNLPRVAGASQGAGQMQAAAEAFVQNKVRITNPVQFDDINAGRVNGKVNLIGPDGKGQYHIKGKEHTY